MLLAVQAAICVSPFRQRQREDATQHSPGTYPRINARILRVKQNIDVGDAPLVDAGVMGPLIHSRNGDTEVTLIYIAG
jgi:hypothetical protein